MIHTTMQILIILMWCISIIYLLRVKKSIDPNLYGAMFFSETMIASSLIHELFANDFNMEWNSPFWYPTNMALCYVFYRFKTKLKNERMLIKKMNNNES